MFCGSCGQPLSKSSGSKAAPTSASAGASPGRKLPDRRKIRAASTRARKAWRLVRRVGRWGFAALFVGASFATLWSNVDRLPIVGDMDIPSIGQVFGGGGAGDEDGGVVLTPTSVQSDGVSAGEPQEPRSLLDLIESVEASTGIGTVQSAFDGDRSTGWTPCAQCPEPFGVGESMTIHFSQPVSISDVAIVNGVEGVDSVLPVMTVDVTFEDGPSIPLGFQETIQRWKFTDERLAVATSELTLTIEGVFRVDETAGTTALGEIELTGITVDE